MAVVGETPFPGFNDAALFSMAETDVFILVADEVPWISAQSQSEDVGIVDRTMVGFF